MVKEDWDESWSRRTAMGRDIDVSVPRQGYTWLKP